MEEITPGAGVPSKDPVSMPAVAAAFEQPALREDQVVSAVGFLSHIKVKGSPPATKRSFLERKGLTPAEIEEAFRRVPEEPPTAVQPSASPTQPATSTSLVKVQPFPLQQQQQQQQYSNALVPASALPLQQQQLVPAQQPVRWSQVVLGLGVAAISAYSFAALVLPKIKEIYASWGALQAQREAEMEARRLEVLAAVTSLEQISRGLETSSRSLAEAVQSFKEQTAAIAGQRALDAVTDNIRNRGDVQPYHDNSTHTANETIAMRRELTEIRAALQRVTGSSRWNTVPAHTSANDPNGSGDAPRGTNRYTGRSSNGSVPAPWYGQQAIEGEDDHRAETLYGPPHSGGTTNYPLSGPRGGPLYDPLAPTSSGGASMAYGGRAAFGPGSSQGGNSQDGAAEWGSVSHEQGKGLRSPQPGQSEPRYDFPTTGALGPDGQTELSQQRLDLKQARPGLGGAIPGLSEWGSLPLIEKSPSRGQQAAEADVPRPQAGGASLTLAEVMDMVAKGITPPNVRKDIVDTPPNPSQPITESRLSPIPKPWERRYEAPDYSSADQAAAAENSAAVGSHVISPLSSQNGGGSRSITGPGSISRSRFATDRSSDYTFGTSVPSEFRSQQQYVPIHGSRESSPEPQAYLTPGSQEQQLLQSFSQQNGITNGMEHVPAATAAAAAVAAAAEQVAQQHHRISILPAPGTGPVWRPPPVPASTMPAHQPRVAAAASDATQLEERASAAAASFSAPAAHQVSTNNNTWSQDDVQTTSGTPLSSFPLEQNMSSMSARSAPNSPIFGSPGPRGNGVASTLNSNAKPFLASSMPAPDTAPAPSPTASPVQKSPRRRNRGAANAAALADATVYPTPAVSQEGGWSVVSPAVQQEAEVDASDSVASPSSPEVQSHP